MSLIDRVKEAPPHQHSGAGDGGELDENVTVVNAQSLKKKMVTYSLVLGG